MALGAPAYVLRFHSVGDDATVTLNGYPVARTAGRPRHVESRKVNDLLVDGDNVFVVDTTRSVVGPADQVAVRFGRGVHSTEPEPVAPIFELQAGPIDGGPADGTPHEVLRHTVRIDRAFGRWAWQDARPYRREDMAEVVALHHAVAAAAARRDVGALVDLFRLKYEELGRSVRTAPAQALAEAAEGWRKILARPEARVAVAADGDLRTTSWSDGRLVEVTGRASMPITIHGATERLQLSVPYVVSVVQGRVAIVR